MNLHVLNLKILSIANVSKTFLLTNISKKRIVKTIVMWKLEQSLKL